MEHARSPTPPMPAELRAGYVPRMRVLSEASAKENTAESASAERRTAAAGQRSAAAAEERAGGGRGQRVAAVDLLLKDAAAERGLAYCEMVLVRDCDGALQVGLDRLTGLCKEARITTAQVEAHATEIGVQETLTRDQIKGLGKFAQFMHLAEKLQIVQFEGELAGRTLLGYEVIRVASQAEWQRVIEATCGFGKYFRARSTVYEMLLKFGFGGQRDCALPTDAVHSGKSTFHKERVLLCCSKLTFDEVKMRRNLKRYTNSQTKMCGREKTRDGLCMLLAAAYEERFGRD